MKLRDVMRPGAFTIDETDCLGNAYSMMNRSHIRHLPVMSGDRLTGILSARDVLSARARVDEADWWLMPVRDAMRSPVQTAHPDDSLTEAAARMASAKIGALPIVDCGKLVGLATVTDVLDAEVRSAMAPGRGALRTAADVMTPYPLAVQPETLLVDAVGIMVEQHVRHLPVVDLASAVVGILSERDVRTAVGDPIEYSETRSSAPVQLRVKDVMTRPAIVAPSDQPLGELARRFTDERFGALPIVDKLGALIGIVSYIDVLRALSR